MTRLTHKKTFVTSREIWTLYCVMIVGALFWGVIWSLAARWVFRFNREAFVFLAVLSITASLCAGFTLYAGLRHLLAKAQGRVQDSDLDLP
jgi:hypothetical protein